MAVKLDPKYKEALNNKGFCLNELKLYKEAIICFDQAILIDQNFKNSYKNKGTSYLKLNEYNKALQCFE